MNVLLDEDGAKIIDFGTSRVVDHNRNMTNAIGTVCYMAPGNSW
jgi:serine/threonine protein kinase